jgi:leucyl-tRNA synthetase
VAEWPQLDESYLQEDSFEYPVMINGKLRFKIDLPLGMEADEIQQRVLAHETAVKWTSGKKPKRFIHVPNKIINIVV